MKALLTKIVGIIVVSVLAVMSPLLPVLALIWVAWKIYEVMYFKGEKFAGIKQSISTYIDDANELNRHIESLKGAALVDNRLDYGVATYTDDSKWKMSRKHLANSKYAPFKYDCSRQVCDNARKEPFKYICKYFNIKADEETLAKFEEILNNFEAVEEGKTSIKAQHDNILVSISSSIPFLIRKFSPKKLEKKLGFEPVDFSTVYFPHYIFRYTSSGGNASTQCDIVMDIDNLNRFVAYLAEKIKFSKSVAGQRALMTSRLRQQIKQRDNFTCQNCGISTEQEPHLLLEIDHIIPVSKGGLTAEDNLQTLCWRCNRTKGARIQASGHSGEA